MPVWRWAESWCQALARGLVSREQGKHSGDLIKALPAAVAALRANADSPWVARSGVWFLWGMALDVKAHPMLTGLQPLVDGLEAKHSRVEPDLARAALGFREAMAHPFCNPQGSSVGAGVSVVCVRVCVALLSLPLPVVVLLLLLVSRLRRVGHAGMRAVGAAWSGCMCQQRLGWLTGAFPLGTPCNARSPPSLPAIPPHPLLTGLRFPSQWVSRTPREGRRRVAKGRAPSTRAVVRSWPWWSPQPWRTLPPSAWWPFMGTCLPVTRPLLTAAALVVAPALVPLVALALVPLEAPALVPLEAPALVPLVAPALVHLEAPALLHLEAPALVHLEAPALLHLEAPALVHLVAPVTRPLLTAAALVVAPALVPLEAPALVDLVAPALLPPRSRPRVTTPPVRPRALSRCLP